MKPLEKQLCLRCEAQGIKTPAETFVKLDGLLNTDYHPMCKQCKNEWEKEYEALDLDNDWRII